MKTFPFAAALLLESWALPALAGEPASTTTQQQSSTTESTTTEQKTSDNGAAKGEKEEPEALAAKDDRSSGDSEPRSPKERFIYADLEAGVDALQLKTFRVDEDAFTAGFLPTSGVGPSASVAAGFRIIFLRLGVRGSVAAFHDDDPARNVGAWQSYNLDAEASVRVPLGKVEPFFGVSGGYTKLAGFQTAVPGAASGPEVDGVNAGLTMGLDYFVSPAVSVGGAVTGRVLFLTRPGVTVQDLATAENVDTINQAKARVLQADGTTVGSSLGLGARMGLHF